MSKKASGPDLTKYIDKQLASQNHTRTQRTLPCLCRSRPPVAERMQLRPFAHALSLSLCVCAPAFVSCSLVPLRCSVKLNGSRQVTGVLRGFDQFMNLVMEDTVEIKSKEERTNIGMVVRGTRTHTTHTQEQRRGSKGTRMGPHSAECARHPQRRNGAR